MTARKPEFSRRWDPAPIRELLAGRQQTPSALEPWLARKLYRGTPLTDQQADTAATMLGQHPNGLWPEYDSAALEVTS